MLYLLAGAAIGWGFVNATIACVAMAVYIGVPDYEYTPRLFLWRFWRPWTVLRAYMSREDERKTPFKYIKGEAAFLLGVALLVIAHFTHA